MSPSILILVPRPRPIALSSVNFCCSALAGEQICRCLMSSINDLHVVRKADKLAGSRENHTLTIRCPSTPSCPMFYVNLRIAGQICAERQYSLTLPMTARSAILNIRHEMPWPSCHNPRRDSNELECSHKIVMQFWTASIVVLINLLSFPAKLSSIFFIALQVNTVVCFFQIDEKVVHRNLVLIAFLLDLPLAKDLIYCRTSSFNSLDSSWQSRLL